MSEQAKLRTCLWFDKNGLDAAKFYVSLLPDSRLDSEYTANPGYEPLTVEFTLAGAPYQILNGGPHYKLSPAASISVLTKDQDETDRLYGALTADGGKDLQCGWLTDRFGLSWQIVPERMLELLCADDKAAAARARDAMMNMRKIDIAALEAAFEN